MSTRGLIGLVCDGQEFLSYNHSDSYPTYLGLNFLEAVREHKLDALRAYARTLVRVGAEDFPAKRDRPRLEALGLLAPGAPKEGWYTLLRDLQGDLDARVRRGIFWWPDDEGFQYSGSCEWAYVANLDDACAELYTGHYGRLYGRPERPKGRYADRLRENPSAADGDRHAVTLLEAIPFEELLSAPDYAVQAYCKRVARES